MGICERDLGLLDAPISRAKLQAKRSTQRRRGSACSLARRWAAATLALSRASGTPCRQPPNTECAWSSSPR